MMKPKTNTASAKSGVFESKVESQKHTDFNTPTGNFNSRRELLESTKLSRLPSLPKRNSFYNNPPVERPHDTADKCVKCDVLLNEDNQKTSANVCAKCLSDFALVEIEINRTAESKARGVWLKKFGGQR